MGFGSSSGTWWVRSKSDPRWDMNGSASALAFSAGPPPEAKAWIEKAKSLIGEPPDDLEWGGMKD